MSSLLTIHPVPARPPNIAQALHPWLTRMGFTLTQDDNYWLTQLEATWTDRAGQQFVLLYVHYHPAGEPQLALGSLHVRPAPGAPALCLVAATHIRKASEVRLLLLANCRYASSNSMSSTRLKYFQEGLSNEQKLAISRQYLQAKEDADFEKIASDKQLAKLEKDKKARLTKLDPQYKAGTISKESYESQKASIEQDYDAKTRQVKKQAAEKEKQFNIAQAVIAGALAVIKASPNVPLMIAAGVTAAAGVAKIIATPIPEFEKGGFFSRLGQGARRYATGGRTNARAGVADVGQRHSGGGIRMVDGATGEHLGEWERGEAYMILSRDTYANNKHLVDELIDTSLHRGGAPVRRQSDYFEAGGFAQPGATAAPAVAGGSSSTQELVQAVRRVEDAVRALPDRQYIGWGQDDTANVEDALTERAADRKQGSIG